MELAASIVFLILAFIILFAAIKAKLANANGNGQHGTAMMSEADPQAAVLSKLAAFVGLGIKVERGGVPPLPNTTLRARCTSATNVMPGR